MVEKEQKPIGQPTPDEIQVFDVLNKYTDTEKVATPDKFLKKDTKLEKPKDFWQPTDHEVDTGQTQIEANQPKEELPIEAQSVENEETGGLMPESEGEPEAMELDPNQHIVSDGKSANDLENWANQHRDKA